LRDKLKSKRDFQVESKLESRNELENARKPLNESISKIEINRDNVNYKHGNNTKDESIIGQGKGNKS